MRIRRILCLSLVTAFAFCTSLVNAQLQSASAPIVITHVTIINPGTSSVRANQTVVITDDRITAISDSETTAPKSARVINGTGQYLIPGFWDMHVHSAFGDWFPGGRDIILPLLVANGVTGVRDMGGDVPVLASRRAGPGGPGRSRRRRDRGRCRRSSGQQSVDHRAVRAGGGALDTPARRC